MPLAKKTKVSPAVMLMPNNLPESREKGERTEEKEIGNQTRCPEFCGYPLALETPPFAQWNSIPLRAARTWLVVSFLFYLSLLQIAKKKERIEKMQQRQSKNKNKKAQECRI